MLKVVLTINGSLHFPNGTCVCIVSVSPLLQPETRDARQVARVHVWVVGVRGEEGGEEA